MQATITSIPLAAGDLWRRQCLLQTGSLFGNEELWHSRRLLELAGHLSRDASDPAPGFDDRLVQQLRNASPYVCRLAAEMLWVMMLFPTPQWVGAERKRLLVRSVWAAGGTELPFDHRLMGEPLEKGILGTGTAYNTQRIQELGYFVDAMVRFRDADHEALLGDAWLFAGFLESVPGGDRRHLRHLLPHLLFPEYFHPIAAVSSKRRIVRAFPEEGQDFSPGPGDPPLVELDRRVHHVAQRLAERHGGPIHFYRSPEVRKRWDPSPADLVRLLSSSAGAVAVQIAQMAAALNTRRNPGAIALAALFHQSGGAEYLAGVAQKSLDGVRPTGTVLRSLFQTLGFKDPDPAAFLRVKSPLSEEVLEDVLSSRWIRSFMMEAQLVAREVSTGRDSVVATHTRHLTALLLGRRDPYGVCALLRGWDVDVDGAREAMLAEIRRRGPGESVEQWRGILLQPAALDAPMAQPSVHPGYRSDAITPGSLEPEHDLLDIMRDVEALCSVLVARENTPPLSVGLFGDWGTGKSFFMELMFSHINRIAEESRQAAESVYCTHVAQVRFNAWHYMDSNLWASLAARIFEGLAEHFDGNRDENAFQALVTELTRSQGVLSEVESERAEAENRLERIQTQISSAQERIEFPFAAAVQTARDRLRSNPQVKRGISSAEDRLGLAPGSITVDNLHERVRQLRRLPGQLRAGLAFLWNAKRRKWVVLGIAVLLGVGLALWWFFPVLRALTLLVWSVPFLSTVGVALKRARAALDALKDADGIVSDAVRKAESGLKRGEREARERLARLESAERDALERVALLEAQLDEVRSGRRLHRFIVERASADDYRQHLGMVNLIRNDFERLSQILTRKDDASLGGTSEQEPPPPRLDRIILYIDDLDRCPEGRVVEVLQAVHLMLAFPLFVVVVGVDSRWLLLSLEDHYAALRRADTLDRRHAHPDLDATPQNYLEKIFQIPFVLKPMGEAGFGNLVEALIPITSPASPPREKSGWRNLPENGRPGQKKARGVAESTPASRADLDDAPDEEDEDDPAVGAVGRVPLQLTPEALRIEMWERDFIVKLHPLIGSPRAAKRFSNVYRFLRARLDDRELEVFRGTRETGGSHRAAALLLAAVVGHPQAAADLFRDLNGGADSATNLADFLIAYESGPEEDARARERRRRLADACRSVAGFEEMAQDLHLDLLRAWSGQVARFCFQSGRTIIRGNPPARAT